MGQSVLVHPKMDSPLHINICAERCFMLSRKPLDVIFRLYEQIRLSLSAQVTWHSDVSNTIANHILPLAFAITLAIVPGDIHACAFRYFRVKLLIGCSAVRWDIFAVRPMLDAMTVKSFLNFVAIRVFV